LVINERLLSAFEHTMIRLINAARAAEGMRRSFLQRLAGG
jgi:hypothetical protein